MSDEQAYYSPKGARAAQAAQDRIKPEFMVRPLEGKVKRTVYDYEIVREEDDGKGRVRTFRRRVEKEIEEDAGYMVYFPSGSMRCTAEELERFGLHRQPGLVDMETGEKIPTAPVVNLEAMHLAKEQADELKKAVRKS